MLLKIEKIILPQHVALKIAKTSVEIYKAKQFCNIEYYSMFVFKRCSKQSLHLSLDSSFVRAVKKSEINFFLALLGTLKAEIENALFGITVGFSKQLDLRGVGYRVAFRSALLVFKLGFSHSVQIRIPAAMNVICPKENVLLFNCSSKKRLGIFISSIQSTKIADVYRTKGILSRGVLFRVKIFKKN